MLGGARVTAQPGLPFTGLSPARRARGSSFSQLTEKTEIPKKMRKCHLFLAAFTAREAEAPRDGSGQEVQPLQRPLHEVGSLVWCWPGSAQPHRHPTAPEGARAVSAPHGASGDTSPGGGDTVHRCCVGQGVPGCPGHTRCQNVKGRSPAATLPAFPWALPPPACKSSPDASGSCRA